MLLASDQVQKAHPFLNALKIFSFGYSWGGYEALLAGQSCQLQDRQRPLRRTEHPPEDRDGRT